MSSNKSSIDENKFKAQLAERVINLLDTKRGIQSELSNLIGKKSNFFGEIKRGKPVNSLHLKAIELMFGPAKLIEILSTDVNKVPSSEKKLPLESGISMSLDSSILEQVIEGVEVQIGKLKRKMAPELKAKVITLLYDSFLKTEEKDFVEQETNSEKAERNQVACALLDNVDIGWLLSCKEPSNSSRGNSDTGELMEMTREVLDSENGLSSSLKTLIRSIHQALNGEEKYKALEKKLEKVGCKHLVTIDEVRIRHDDPPQEREEIVKRRAI
ncbi:hypothetical protein [uncultured Desulfosarcina sp.]|uniref:hypothetical protein n=1 Tax=uncultured Desulfosarcina sp. TaxID=218289 RepID=UPI0029C96DC0|nr:hypothetical protein [uncultured Desulfosarcina sp.]